MSAQPIYLVDAFADRPFTGNPAGVAPLAPGTTISDELMQAIAFEMNQAETAFLTPRAEPNLFGLRWFTPTVEVDLCGHATLASAHILWTTGLVKGHAPIRFETRSEILSAEFESGRIVLDFPSESPDPADLPIDAPFAEGAVFVGQNRMDWFIEYEHASQIRDFQPDFPLIASMGKRGLIVTAPADDGVQDFISRFFAPQSGVPEDPVTGSAHCGLAPYWAHRLGKDELSGYQASQRGGVVGVKVCGDRVKLIGKAITTLEGKLACL